MATIQEVLDNNFEHAVDIVERALKATNWPEFLITEKAEIRVPEGAGRILNISREEIARQYRSREQLLDNPPPNFHLIRHPMINHKLTMARNVETGEFMFNHLISEIAMALSVYATEDLEEEPIQITTPICDMVGSQILGRKPTVIPIWRAGDGMKQGLREWLTHSRVGNVGLYRKHDTLLPIVYYAKMLEGTVATPEGVKERTAYICDPMLATGVSAVAAIEIAKSFGYKKIKFLATLSVAQGVNSILLAHPDVEIYTAALDEGLDQRGYIVPGLGDAGKRLSGTEWEEEAKNHDEEA